MLDKCTLKKLYLLLANYPLWDIILKYLRIAMGKKRDRNLRSAVGSPLDTTPFVGFCSKDDKVYHI